MLRPFSFIEPQRYCPFACSLCLFRNHCRIPLSGGSLPLTQTTLSETLVFFLRLRKRNGVMMKMIILSCKVVSCDEASSFIKTLLLASAYHFSDRISGFRSIASACLTFGCEFIVLKPRDRCSVEGHVNERLSKGRKRARTCWKVISYKSCTSIIHQGISHVVDVLG
jgi:hypothetical protein